MGEHEEGNKKRKGRGSIGGVSAYQGRYVPTFPHTMREKTPPGKETKKKKALSFPLLIQSLPLSQYLEKFVREKKKKNPR